MTLMTAIAVAIAIFAAWKIVRIGEQYDDIFGDDEE